MTPYELIYLANEFEATLMNEFMGQVTLLSGFLVVSYLVAKELNLFLSAIMILLYTLITYVISLSILTKMQDLRDVIAIIQMEIESGKQYPNLRMYQAGSLADYDASYYIFMAVIIFSYLAAIAFFLIRKFRA